LKKPSANRFRLASASSLQGAILLAVIYSGIAFAWLIADLPQELGSLAVPSLGGAAGAFLPRSSATTSVVIFVLLMTALHNVLRSAEPGLPWSLFDVGYFCLGVSFGYATTAVLVEELRKSRR